MGVGVPKAGEATARSQPSEGKTNDWGEVNKQGSPYRKVRLDLLLLRSKRKRKRGRFILKVDLVDKESESKTS